MESTASTENGDLAMMCVLLGNMIEDDDDDTEELHEQMLLQMLITLLAHYFMEEDEYQTRRARAPVVPLQRYRFNNSTLDPVALFRFSEVELRYIVRLMNEPGIHHTASRDKFTLLEGLCILTRRLCYPCRWADVVHLFGRSVSALNRIYLHMLTKMMNKYSHLLLFDVNRFAAKLPQWAAAVTEACPNTFTAVVLFLDGTHRKTCRPGPSSSRLPRGITRDDVQRSQYDGRLHKHGQKYHALVAPNGLIVHAFGPVDGRRHDTTVLRESGLALGQADLTVNGVDYCIYADSAYALTRNMQRPFRTPVPNSMEAKVNTAMARARTVASECGYATITNTWQNVDWVRQQKIFWTRPADMYLCAVLFTNMRLCIRRSNLMSEFFNLSDSCPTLSAYLSGDWNE